MAVNAWCLESKEPVSLNHLERLGIKVWDLSDKEKLANKCKELGLDKQSICLISRGTTPDSHIDELGVEHLHENDEVRFVLGGSGYLDIRDEQDKWIRYHMKKDQFSVVPAGMYHRFLLDERQHFKAFRLYNNQMTPYRKAFHRDNDSTDVMPARRQYLKKLQTA